MGSPLAPILANLFMGHNEAKWISEYDGKKPHFYKRYVDADQFFEYINNKHVNIKFTKEYNNNGTIPFLDILISNVNGLKTSVYHKPTYTGLLTNFKSFIPYSYKTRLIHTLLDRTFKITSDWIGFHHDIDKLSNFLLRNLFPKKIIDKMLKRFLDKKFKITDINDTLKNKAKEVRYIKLQYIGEISKTAKTKISRIISRFCNNNIKINIVFDTCKIGSYFSTKDSLPKSFSSSVIYRFSCRECNSCYVGRTHKYFEARRKEHLETDKSSAIHKHLNTNSNCKTKNNINSFTIIDYAKTDFELALKEAMHIKWLNPDLNGQKKHEIIRLLI